MTGLHNILEKVIPHHNKDGSSSHATSSQPPSRPESAAASRKSTDSKTPSEVILKSVYA